MVPAEHRVPQLNMLRALAGEKAGWNQINTEPAGAEHIQAAAEEIGICIRQAVSRVRVGRLRCTAFSVGWSRHNQPEPPRKFGLVLLDPSFEGSLEEVQLRLECAKHRGADRAVLDSTPPNGCELGPLERSDEPPDPGA